MTSRRAEAHGPSARPQGTALRRTVLAVLLALLPVLAGVAPTSYAGASRAPSASVAQSVTVTLTSSTPRVLRSGSGVVLTGTVHNAGTAPVSAPVVHAGVVDDPLNTRERVDRWVRSGEGFDKARTIGSTGLTEPLPPGGRAAFTIRVPASALPFSYNLASLPTSLTVTEGPSITAASVRGVQHTYLEWVGGSISKPVDVGWVVPLTLPADPDLFGPSGDKRLEAWRRAIGPESTIARTLDALEGQPVTWLVDPTMLEPPGAADLTVRAEPEPTPTPSTSTSTTSSATSTSSDPTGSATPSSPAPSSTPATSSTSAPSGGSSSSAPSTSSSSSTSEEAEPAPATTVSGLAAELRDRLSSTRSTQPVWFLPYGDPDVTALHGSGGATQVRTHLDRPLSSTLHEIGTTMPLWPASDVNQTTLSSLLSTWQQTHGSRPPTLLSTRQLTGEQRRTTTQSGQRLRDGTPVLTYDEPLSFLAAAGGGDPGLREQRWLAETLATYQQQPSEHRSLLMLAPRTGQASPAQLARMVGASRGVPWLRTVSTGSLLTEATAADRSASVVTSRQSPSVPTQRSPIAPSHNDVISHNRSVVSSMGTILVDSSDVTTGWDRALDELGSARWRGQATAYGTVLDADTTALDSLTRQVAVRPSTVNFFANSGMLNITVVNNLARPVRDVQLMVTPRKRLLWVKRQPTPLSLPAGGRTTVRVPVEAVAAGTVNVDASLTTPGGAPLGQARGKSVQLKVNVRPTATWIYWVLGMVAGLIFVVGLFRSLRKGPRAETAMPLPDDVPEPTEGDDD